MQNILVEVRTDGGVVLGSASVRPLQEQVEVDVALSSVSSGTLLTAVAFATNGVGLKSEAALSPQHHMVLSALDGGSAWILDGSGLRQNSSFHKNRYGFSIAASGAVDPMDADAQFAYSWSVAEAPCTSPPNEYPMGAIRVRSSSGELNAAAGMLLVEGRTYCGLVTACTAPSVSFPAGRCASVQTNGVTIDVSAPLSGARPLPQRGSTAGSAMPLTVAIRCSDPHSGISRLALSLGTELGAEDLASGLVVALPWMSPTHFEAVDKCGEAHDTVCSGPSASAAIRCCAIGAQNTCVDSVCSAAYGNNGLDPISASFAGNAVSQAEAGVECAAQGGRLCTSAELESQVCCGTGCSHDHTLVWSTTSCTDAGSANASGDGLRVQGRANRTHIAGNVTVSRSMLLTAVTEGTAIFVSISCTNAAGMQMVVSDVAAVHIDTVPPRAGSLHLPSLYRDGDGLFHSDAASSVPLNWSGFSDDGVRVMQYVVCVGSSPSACDVEELTASTAAAAFVSLQMYSRVSRGSATSATVFVSVAAVDGMQRTNSSNVAVLLDWSPPVIGNVSRPSFKRAAAVEDHLQQL